MEPLRDTDSDPWSGLEPAERKARAHALAMRETWMRFSSRHRETDLEPFSPEWFHSIDGKRYLRHAAWIAKLFGFERHSGERVLVFGAGIGTDAARFAANGAKVVACTPDPDNVSWIERNFDARNLTGSVHHCAADNLPAPSETVDIVAIACFENGPASFENLFAEAWRVLRPGGKIIAVVPAAAHRKADLKASLAAFEIRKLGRRHLRRSDLPTYLRWAYFPILERAFGRVYAIKAVKPIRAAVPLVHSKAA